MKVINILFINKPTNHRHRLRMNLIFRFWKKASTNKASFRNPSLSQPKFPTNNCIFLDMEIVLRYFVPAFKFEQFLAKNFIEIGWKQSVCIQVGFSLAVAQNVYFYGYKTVVRLDTQMFIKVEIIAF